MKNIIYRVLLPVTLFVTVVTSQSSQCSNVLSELDSNQPCYNAVAGILSFFNDTTGTVFVTREILNAYCTSTCRNLYLQLSAACFTQSETNNPVFNRALNDLECSVDGDKNCINFLKSSEFDALDNSLEPSGQCSSFSANGTCSQSCAAVVEDFITVGKCCARQILDFERNYGVSPVSYDDILSLCDITRPQFTSCQVINNGAGGLKTSTFGVLLLIATFVATIF